MNYINKNSKKVFLTARVGIKEGGHHKNGSHPKPISYDIKVISYEISAVYS